MGVDELVVTSPRRRARHLHELEPRGRGAFAEHEHAGPLGGARALAIARTVGWVTHWREMVSDPSTRIGRPRQLYIGHDRRDYVPVSKR